MICASAGNHAQGVALSCKLLNINAKIFMPNTTPSQKVSKVKMFGKDKVEVILLEDSYDDCHDEAFKEAIKRKKEFHTNI